MSVSSTFQNGRTRRSATSASSANARAVVMAVAKERNECERHSGRLWEFAMGLIAATLRGENSLEFARIS